MTAKIKLGFVPTRRSVFSAPDALKYRDLTAARMKELGIDGTRLQYWGLLKDFIEDVVKPSLTVIEEEQSFINKLSASKEDYR